MILAAFNGKPDVLRVLLDKGANIEAKNIVRDGYGDHVYSVGEGGWGEGERREGRGCKGGVEGWSNSFKFCYSQIYPFNLFQTK